MRQILNCRTYQLSGSTRPTNETDTRFYSHYYARRLPAEVLLDAIASSTGVADSFPGYPAGLRAVQLPDPGLKSYFLSLFGRSDRVTAWPARHRRGDHAAAVALAERPDDHRQIGSGDGRLSSCCSDKKTADAVVDELFLATLSPGRRTIRRQRSRRAWVKETSPRRCIGTCSGPC